jgi:hypothetical protein
LPDVVRGDKDYNKDVRYYTTKRTDGGIVFKCIVCEHSVTTLNFDSTKGNCRTQAAAAMNQHAAELHLSSSHSSAPAKLGSRGAL